MDAHLAMLGDPLMATLHHLLDHSDEQNKNVSAPTRKYVRDARAMAATPADVKELSKSYLFVIDMPGVKSGDLSVQVEDENVLVISGERKRERDEASEEKKEEAGVKYLRMERRMGKFMRKFVLPENADLEGISAECKDGVLTVTVMKKPPPEPKKPKTVQVHVA